MAILIALLTISAAKAERVRFCFLFCSIESDAPADSFCSAYERVIRNTTDSADVKNLQRGPKSRVIRNDALYRCTCEGWKHPICSK